MIRDSGISKAVSPMLRSSMVTAPLPAPSKSKLSFMIHATSVMQIGCKDNIYECKGFDTLKKSCDWMQIGCMAASCK